MHQVTRQVKVWDCGNEGCCHIKEEQAIKCMENRVAMEAKLIKDLLVFKMYMTTRIPVKLIAKKYHISVRTVKYKTTQLIDTFYYTIFTQEECDAYGTDLSLTTAVNENSKFWATRIEDKLQELLF